MSMKNRFRFACAGLALLALAAACGGKEDTEEEVKPAEVPTISAEVGKVTRQDVTSILVVRGTITAVPNEDVKVSALVPGRVVAVHVAEGDSVRAGQVVAAIDRRILEDQRRQAAAAVNQAKAALENARLNLERTERLFQRGIAAGKEVEDARAQMAAAQASVDQSSAALDTATRQLDRTEVTSPIAGQVVKRLVAVGEQVDGTAAQPIVEVANLQRVELAANVPAESLGRMRIGDRVAITSDAYPGRTFDGEVVAIAPAVDPATNAGLARVRITNPDRLLKVGMFAQARVPVEQHRGALTVPPSAISQDEQQAPVVYVVKGDLAQRTPVKLGLQTPEAVEILSGVSEGQSVLVSSVHGLGEKARLGKTS